MEERVSDPEYRKGQKLYSDMSGEDYAEIEILDVWKEKEENRGGEEVDQYYYKFKFTNEHSPREPGTIIDKRRAEEFEDCWHLNI